MIGIQELFLILVILLIVIGPKKLPEMAKELGRAIQELNKKTAEVTNMATSALQGEDNESEDKREAILTIAGNLGISTEGKSVRQLIKEIKEKG